MSEVVKFKGTQNFKVFGQNIHAPFGGNLTYTFAALGPFGFAENTACMQGFQISPDEIGVITGYHVHNPTPYPITIALNDSGNKTIPAGGYAQDFSPGSADGENPVTFIMVYTEVFQPLACALEVAIYGDP